jgi:hypothetical protein
MRCSAHILASCCERLYYSLLISLVCDALLLRSFLLATSYVSHMSRIVALKIFQSRQKPHNSSEEGVCTPAGSLADSRAHTLGRHHKDPPYDLVIGREEDAFTMAIPRPKSSSKLYVVAILTSVHSTATSSCGLNPTTS